MPLTDLFYRLNVAVELPFLGAEIAFMQLSVPKTKRSAAAPWGGVCSNGLDRRSASGAGQARENRCSTATISGWPKAKRALASGPLIVVANRRAKGGEAD